jgi:ankyrin repeat protein
VFEEDDYGSTGLNVAMECGNEEIVRILVEAGSDLHHGSVIHLMPLHSAAYYGEKNLLEMLLKAGADVNRQPARRHTRSSGTALHAARKSEIVRILLDHGADVNAVTTDQYGVTPLHIAANGDPTSKDAVEKVQLLLDHGANVNAKSNAGETPLYYAKRSSHDKTCTTIIDLLLKYGAKEEGPQVKKPKGSSTDKEE